MSVIRVLHNKHNPYVMLNKSALLNPNLSLKAIGLWAKCLARPDNWKFNIKELASSGKEGRRAIDSAINELIENDYAMRIEHYEKDEDGHFTGGGVEYIIFEFPATEEEKQAEIEEFKKSFRHCYSGDCRSGDCRNSNLLNKESTKEQIEKNNDKETIPKGMSKKVASKEAPPPASPQEVSISPEEYQKLIEKYPKIAVDEKIEELEDYLAQGHKYKNHPAAVRSWIRREIKEFQKKGKDWHSLQSKREREKHLDAYAATIGW